MQRMLCSFIKRTEKNAKNTVFFYKEQKRMQRTLHYFIKNGKERKNVVFFWKEWIPNPGINASSILTILLHNDVFGPISNDHWATPNQPKITDMT